MGLSRKRYRDYLENEQNPLLGLFNCNTLSSMLMGQSGQKILDRAKFDALQMRYKEEISSLTNEMVQQIGQSPYGKQLLQQADSPFAEHKTVGDLAVLKISKNLQVMYEYDSWYREAMSYDRVSRGISFWQPNT